MTPSLDARRVEKVAWTDEYGGWHLRLNAVTKLLRAERAKIRRMVKRLVNKAKTRPMGFERTDGYFMACDDLLAALKERR